MQMSKGITVKDVNAHEFVEAYAKHLKKQAKIQPIENVDLVKTGIAKELAPYNEDWFYIRCGKQTLFASVFSSN
jgi:small subunit ribosomal protein S19e